MIFDTHAHYDDSWFDGDRDGVLRSLSAAGVGAVVDVCASRESLRAVPELCGRYDFVYGAAGLHPDDVGDLTPEVLEEIRGLLRQPKIVAAGEIGLDYHWDVRPHEEQVRCFKEQILLAKEAGKPIIVHSRAAAADTLRVIQEMYAPGGERCGIIHSYSGSLEQAKIYVSLGFFLGIGGVVTYTTSKKLKKVVTGIPLEYLVLETDCPYLAPEPVKGQRNSSALLRYVVRAVAELKGVTEEEVERMTWDNAVRLFGL